MVANTTGWRAGASPLFARRAMAALAVAAASLLLRSPAATAAAEGENAPLRVCADPDNLPFTSRTGATPGLYLDLARQLAGQLDRPLEVVWAATYAPQRMLRTTLLAHKCDMFVGVPAEASGKGHTPLSTPVIEVGYALVTPAGSDITGLGALRGKHVAVEFGSPPQALMAERRDVDAMTVTSPEEGMRALRDGRADAALLWGPSAGYTNVTAMGSRYRVTPLPGDAMRWSAAIAFAPGEDALRDKVNALLAGDRAVIHALAARYGFPLADDAVQPAAASQTESLGFGEDLQIPSVTKGAALPPGSHSQAQPPAGEGAGTSTSGQAGGETLSPAAVREGTDLFNSTCAHCHGPDAVQSERRINLRLLRHRYGDTMDQVFFTTVTHGRPDKGMPNWTGVFTDDQFRSILAFLHSVQEDQ